MLLATLLLSAALSPQTPPGQAEKPPKPAPAAPARPAPAQAAPSKPAPAKPANPAPAEPAMPAPTEPPAPSGLQATDVPPAASADATSDIEAGLKAFRRHRFARARDEFDKAVKVDPQSAAANFYLGYAHYKLGEPSRHMNPDKEMAKELFAKAFQLDPSFEPVWGRKPQEPEKQK